MNLLNFICSFEEAQLQLLKEKISHDQYLTETHVLNKKMIKAGFKNHDRSDAKSEGERNATQSFTALKTAISSKS